MSQNTRLAFRFGLLLAVWFAGVSPAASGGAEANGPSAAGRSELDFDFGWRFSKSDPLTAMAAGFDDSGWRELDLPHDWSIEGPFGPENASGTGYAPGGVGWYRKHFRVDENAKGKLAFLEFDGVYNHSEVWLNGHFIGGRPYGYSSFECELTPVLKYGGDNVVAVRVDHSRFADSRWYTGSGIYRDVRLRFTEPMRIAPWGVFVTTPKIGSNGVTIRVETTVLSSGQPQKASLRSDLVSPEGVALASITTSDIAPGSSNSVVQHLAIPKAELWSPDSPKLYSIRSRLASERDENDEVSTAFGIRSFSFDPDHGFALNGRPMKLQGVCVHHEAGCLGAAVPERVWERRLRLLREIGVNAIRTSHNPPAPEFLDLCDRLGLLVMDEAFDEFTPAKNKWVSGRNNGQASRYGYAEDFEEWSVRDISDMVRRDRNHPSIILWSIGNEIDYANDPFTDPILGGNYRPGNPPAQDLVRHARPLIAAVKGLDGTRPVTAALANVGMSDAVGLGEMLDVVGYNYQESRYASDHAKYPKRVMYGSENFHQANAWAAVREHDYISGQFLWTGIDYLGEANRWPNHGSSAGLLDLAGFRKPLAYFRQSLWSRNPMVYLCASPGRNGERFGRVRAEESWNWPSNAMVTVRCYTTCREVELSLNGKSLGVKESGEPLGGALEWEVPFEPGTLTATGRDDNRAACVFTLKTAGAPQGIELLPDVKHLASDGHDVAQIELRVVDAQGLRVPTADQRLTLEVEGPARLLGVENGDLNTPPDYPEKSHRVYQGRGIVYLKSGRTPGTVTLKLKGEGLAEASVTLDCSEGKK